MTRVQTRMKAKPAKNPPKTSMFADMLRQVRRVPRGKVATYGDIAYEAGYPGAARQVAWALHAESVGLPWHRIVGAGGTILLTGEQGFEQRMHLQAEGVGFLGLKVNMTAHRYTFSGDVDSGSGEVKSANTSATNTSAKCAGAKGAVKKPSGKSAATGRPRREP